MLIMCNTIEDRFRPNIVLEGCDAHAEDVWKQIQIGRVLTFEKRLHQNDTHVSFDFVCLCFHKNEINIK